MARIIPQAQPDPFAPQVAGLYGTRDRPSTKFQTVNRFLDTAKAVADSPLTGLALRGIQAGAGGISDMLSAAAARRMEEYKTGNMDLDRMAELAAPEPYKPMEGLSLSGKEPKGLGLSLRDMPEQEPAQGWSAESRRGDELMDTTLGDDLARAAQRKLGVEPVDARQSALGKGILPAFTSPRLPGLEMDPDAARLDATIAESPQPRPRPVGASAVKQSLIDNTVMGAFVSPRVPGLEMDPDAVRLTRPPQRPAGPSAPMLPQPRVPRIADSEPLPTAEQLGERRRNPPLTLDFEGEPEAQPPRPPIATQTEDDRDNAWRKFVEGEDAASLSPEPTDTGPTLKEDLRLKAPGLRDLKPDVDLEDVTVPSGSLEGVAEAAPVLGRSGRLAAATDEQLNGIRNSLQGDDPETQRRIAQIDRELQHRADVTRVAERALTPEELIKRARMAGTAEEQAQVLADSARVRLPITSVADLIGDGREKAFRQELLGVFPAAPKKTAEQIAAEIALSAARAEAQRAGGGYSTARAEGVRLTAPALADKYTNEAYRAGEQGASEEDKRAGYRAKAGLDNTKADDLKATLAGRMKKTEAEANRAQAQADKFAQEVLRIKKRVASYGRPGGASKIDLDKDIKKLEILERTEAASVKSALSENAPTDKEIQDAFKANAAIRQKLLAVKAPGDEPPRPESFPKNTDPSVVREAGNKHAKWLAETGAYNQARQDLPAVDAKEAELVTWSNSVRQARATVAQNARLLGAIKGAVRDRIAKDLGIPVGLPAQEPTAPPARPAAPAPAGRVVPKL